MLSIRWAIRWILRRAATPVFLFDKQKRRIGHTCAQGHEASLLLVLSHTAICCPKKNEFWERIEAAGLAYAKSWNERIPVETSAKNLRIGDDTMAAASFLKCPFENEFPYVKRRSGYCNIKIPLDVDDKPDATREVSEHFLTEKTETSASSKSYNCCDFKLGLSKSCNCNLSQQQGGSLVSDGMLASSKPSHNPWEFILDSLFGPIEDSNRLE
jgi:hypothetical protein